jgi:hypothetical protein
VRVEIDHLALGLRLTGEHERLEPVMRRVRALADGRLQTALACIDAASIVSESASTDEEIVFVERLNVDCSANTNWDDDAIAAHLARRLALALQARVADPRVLRFRDRADYVAAALMAFAEGRANLCWWFDELDGLRHLSASAALRTLVISEGDAGAAALTRLTDAALSHVLGALGDGDGARLLVWLDQRSGYAAVPLGVLWEAAIPVSERSDQTAWLRAIIAADRSSGRSANGGSLRALRSFAALRRLARGGALGESSAEPQAWLRGVLQRHRLDAQWLEAAPDGFVSQLIAELTVLAAAAPHPGTPSAWFETPEGGFFVLLGRLHGLGWLQAWQALFRADADRMTPGEADALCRALACNLVACALAGPHAARVLHDGAVQAACAMPDATERIARNQAVARAALRTVLRGPTATVAPDHRPALRSKKRHHRTLMRLIAEAAAVLLADCARALPGLAGSSRGFLRSQALAMHASVHLSGDVTTVRLSRPPLNVLLVLTGVKRVRIALPGAAPVQLMEDHGA